MRYTYQPRQARGFFVMEFALMADDHIDHIDLSVHQREDGVLEIRDQHGRVVNGLKRICLRNAVDETVEFEAVILDRRLGEPWDPHRPPSCKPPFRNPTRPGPY